MDGITENLIENIGEDWKGIEDSGDQKEQKERKHQKQFKKRIKKRKKKMSENLKELEQKNGIKKTKWVIYRTYIINYKVLGTRTFKRRVLS